MINAIKYFSKRKITFVIIVTIMLLLWAMLFIHRKSYMTYYYFISSNTYVHGPDDVPISFISTWAAILCTLVPIFDFSFKMRKISIDQMYSLPIKREKIYLSKFIVGFVSILIPITIAFFDCIINILLSEHMYDLIYFIPYYFSLIGTMFILYSTVTFFFTRGNTVRDGIINIIAISFIFVLIVGLIGTMVPIDAGGFFIYSPIITMNNYFNFKICEKGVLSINAWSKYNMSIESKISLVLMILVGIASFILFVILNKKDKAENSMQISNSWFSYRVMIPTYFSLLLIFFIVEGVEVGPILFLIMITYIGYIIYRRSIKLNKWDYIVFGICLVSSIAFGFILKEIVSSNMIIK